MLLLHLCLRLATGSFAPANVSPSLHAALAALMVGCLALSFAARLAPLAVAGALCVMLALLNATFPTSPPIVTSGTSNFHVSPRTVSRRGAPANPPETITV